MNEGPVLLRDLPITARDPRPYGGLNIFSPVVKSQSTDLFELCKKYGLIQPNCSILDLGCGTGRILSKLQQITKNAVGFDICERFLGFCRPYNLRTYHVDVEHPEFNPTGKVDPLSAFLPFKEGSYERVIGIAVLNHQDITRAQTIIKEALRVTKKGGLTIFTVLLLNAQSRFQLQQNQCVFKLQEKTDDWWVSNVTRPYLNCALDETIIRRTIIENRGQVVEPIYYGQWRQLNHAPTGHDLLVIRKI